MLHGTPSFRSLRSVIRGFVPAVTCSTDSFVSDPVPSCGFRSVSLLPFAIFGCLCALQSCTDRFEGERASKRLSSTPGGTEPPDTLFYFSTTLKYISHIGLDYTVESFPGVEGTELHEVEKSLQIRLNVFELGITGQDDYKPDDLQQDENDLMEEISESENPNNAQELLIDAEEQGLLGPTYRQQHVDEDGFIVFTRECADEPSTAPDISLEYDDEQELRDFIVPDSPTPAKETLMNNPTLRSSPGALFLSTVGSQVQSSLDLAHL